MARRSRPSILLIGHGAIAAEVRAAALSSGLFDVGAVLVRHEKVGSVGAELNGYKVIDSLEELDFKPVLAMLKRRNYGGWVSLEAFDFTPGAERLANESLRYLEQEIAKLPE